MNTKYEDMEGNIGGLHESHKKLKQMPSSLQTEL